jgi:BlaI family transcriptional regulator, penicillinase repressor
LNAQSAISETELAVLKVLWDRGAGTVREVQAVLQEQGRTWAYTTVQTLLNRLQGKRYALCEKGGTAHIFRPAVSRDQLLQNRLHALADEFCEGTASPLVLALVEGGRFTPDEIERFRRMLDQLEADKPRKKSR